MEYSVREFASRRMLAKCFAFDKAELQLQVAELEYKLQFRDYCQAFGINHMDYVIDHSKLAEGNLEIVHVSDLPESDPRHQDWQSRKRLHDNLIQQGVAARKSNGRSYSQDDMSGNADPPVELFVDTSAADEGKS